MPESLVPNFLPMDRPASQMKNVTTAMMREQTRAISQPYSEMVKPTDSASMLVATPCTKSAPALSSAASSASSPLMPSSSILPPMYPSRSNAIHGMNCSKDENSSTMVWTQIQPAIGMIA